MRKTAAFACALVAMLPLLGAAQELRFQPEPDFNSAIGRAVEAVKPADAFSLPACRMVDAKYVAPVALVDAQKLLSPCLAAISQRYGAQIAMSVGTLAEEGRLSAQVEVLILSLPAGVSVTSPLMRDLSHGLALRGNRLLGHPVVLRHDDPKVSAESANLAQDALARCVMPMVMRRIDSGEDFIKYYGNCLRHDSALAVVDLKPWAGHQLGVIVVTRAAKPVMESLNTSVSVAAANGQVKVELVAYPQFVYRP